MGTASAEEYSRCRRVGFARTMKKVPGDGEGESSSADQLKSACPVGLVKPRWLIFLIAYP